MSLFDKKIKTAWVSGFDNYEWDLIEKLKKKGFNINVMDNIEKAVQELEKEEYNLIVVSSELYADGDIDDDFRRGLHNCRKENVNDEIDCSKVSLYFIDRIKKGRKSEINQHTPIVVIDYFCRFPKDFEKERFILAGAIKVIDGKMSLEDIANKLSCF